MTVLPGNSATSFLVTLADVEFSPFSGFAWGSTAVCREEFDNLRLQIARSSWGGRRHPPYAFTEQGIAMLAF
jgi:hypothetical protein